MQTGTVENRITNAGHAYSAILPIAPNQIVVDDQRLHDWTLADIGSLGEVAYPIRAYLNDDGEIVRIRTLASNLLDIRYTTFVGDTVTWSSNVVSFDALTGSGVDLYVDANEIDAFWLDADGITIKTAHSSDGGHTFGSASAVATLPNQGSALPQLCAPQENVVVFTDSTVGLDEDSNAMTALYVVVKVSGTWNTPTLWDLGGQHLGIETPITLPNASTYTSNISGVLLPDGRVEVSFYGHNLRETAKDGLWVERIGNIDTTNATQHLQWSHPKDVMLTVAIDDDNNSTEIFSAFPILQPVGDEFWILALESSEYAGHQRYYFSYFRSADGIHWTNRETHQGAANDDQVGAHCYNGDTPFVLTDLIYANLIVTSARTFIVGYDRVFFCPSTTLVGVTNPAKQLDLTDICDSWNVNLPTAPTSSSANYHLSNVPKNWNSDDLLAAHKGIRILHKAGYNTDTAHGDEFVEIGQFWIDRIRENAQIGSLEGTINAIDSMMLLERYKTDIGFEWFGSQQMYFQRICDLTPFTITQGSYLMGSGGRMRAGVVKKSDNFRDNIAVFNMDSTDGVIAHYRVRCDITWTNNHMGFAIQGRAQGDENDNRSFWAILYNRVAGKFSLNQAIPRTNPNRVKLYRYRTAVATSSAINLNAGQWYWVRVANWHNHVMVWYTTETSPRVPDPNWILAIDFTSAASPATQVMPARIGWQGWIGTQRTSPSGALGQVNRNGSQQDLMDGSGNPYMVAIHQQLGSVGSTLRSVNVSLSQENTNSDPMPDATVLILAGDAASPYNATDDDNVIFSSDMNALKFGSHTAPTAWAANSVPNPMPTKFDADEHIWIAVTFDGTLTAGQSYKWSSSPTGDTCKISSDGGATWSNAPAHLFGSVQVDYLAGRVKYHKLFLTTGDNIQTYEELAHQLAAKAGVLEISPFDWLAQADMILEADNIYWQPEDYGTIGELVVETDVTISTTARIIIGSTTIGLGDTNAFIIEIDPTAQTIAFYDGVTLLSVSESLQYIPDSFHLQIVNQNDFLYVYINECLASMWYNLLFTDEGYFGVDSVGAAWSNLRIPDMRQTVDYWSLDEEGTSQQSLQQLTNVPAVGAYARVKYFIRYDGSLRIGTFPHQDSVDTYDGTIEQSSREESAQYVVSQLVPRGRYYARRTEPTILDSDGRWFDLRDFTGAQSDTDAYNDAGLEFQDVREKSDMPNESHRAVWTTEREDIHTIIEPQSSIAGEYIVNDINWSYNPSNGTQQALQRIGYRKRVVES